MEIDPRQLACLLSISEQGSFSRAAAKLNLSQPALSRTIAQLERAIGARVLERGRFGAKLNELGRVLVHHAEALQVLLKRAREEAELSRSHPGGALVVGVTPVSAADLVPMAVADLKSRQPNVSIRILELPFELGRAALKRGEIDLYVGPLQQLGQSSDFHEETVVRDPLCAVVSITHPLASRRSIGLKEASRFEWALPTGSNALMRQLQALFLAASLPYPHAAVTTDSMLALKGVVKHGRFITIMPRTLVALECAADQLRAIRLTDAGNPRLVGLAWSPDRTLTPLATAFVEALRRQGRISARTA
jgi:molybdate transport repressor ModE-like protein